MLFARVAVPVPLGRAFTYTVPPALESRIVPGLRVLCEFGRRRVLGIVIEVSDQPPSIAIEKLKPLTAVVDDAPVLPEELLGFLRELARYYVAPIGEVMRLALPAVARTHATALAQQGFPEAEQRAVGRLIQVACAVAGDSAVLPEGPARALYEALQQRGPVPIAELEREWPNARGAVKRLQAKGLATVEKVERTRDPFSAPVPPDRPPELTPAQARAVARIDAQLTAHERQPFLLQGVTGSGKTEVYLRAVQRCLALGRGAIVLVPEIALTPQLVARFRARIGDAIAVLHSGLAEVDRYATWKKLRSAEIRVAVGARSALFAPVHDLALVCVDEEHDGSFKQEEGVRYNARDMALLRAHRAGAVCVLGSATPSLSSEASCRSGRIEKLELPERARATAVLPEVEIVDLRRVGAPPSGHKLLSLPLYRAIESTLGAGQQTILFLNRRGFAPSLVCEACGKFAECPNCSVALTLHRSGGDTLRCHYCDHAQRTTQACPSCGSNELSEEGAGTERIEQTLSSAFPTARIARLDRDVASGKNSERILERMHRAELDILVGTQMVTKGHDLPNVTLVGVMNADAALSLPDFRASERTFHLLVQVAGRAGRGNVPGKVLIQTRQPEHPAIRFAARHDVNGFTERELKDREELSYPPYSRLALVRVDAVEERRAAAEAARLADVARARNARDVLVLGPAPAPLIRLRNRYRYRFMLRSKQPGALHEVLLAVARVAESKHVRVQLDMDPMSML
ncbi:MAG TPA: primosomal protein N' [Polyangiaceae bacterium]|nr:primosomal protein N' [Polyangiaceae bacterium]